MMAQYSQKVLSQARKTRGYLEKRSSGLLSVWQKRYFLILEEGLSYYADETLEEVKKTIPMQEIKNIKLAAANEFQLVTKKRIYELRAEDEATRDLWVASLNILINHKEWIQSANDPKKETNSNKRSSKNKKLLSRATSPPQLSKASSSSASVSVSRWRSLEAEFTAEGFFSFVCLPKLAEQWSRESIRNKVLLLKEARGCYFMVSCKSLLHPEEDAEFLSQDLVYPYDFNCLYFFEFAKADPPEVVVEIGKCAEFQSVEAEPGAIRIQLPKRGLAIRVEQKRMETVDVQTIIKKLRAAAKIGKEYHNPLKIKIKRNIDPLLYKYETKQRSIEQIVAKEFQGGLVQGKEGKQGKQGKEGKDTSPSKNQFKKSLDNLRRIFKEVVHCCEAKGSSAAEFKEKYVIAFHEKVYEYVQRGWSASCKIFSSFQAKKVIIILQQFWRVSRQWLGESGIFLGAVAILRTLVQKYEEQIIGKINSCFLLPQTQLIGEVTIPVKEEENALSKVNTVFLSNKIFRQFHLDIRLVLYEFSQMPVHQSAIECYMALFSNTFRYLSEQTFKFLDKWRDLGLILGTCNEIQFIKNSLFQEMFDKLTKDYPQMAGKLKRESLKDLEGEVNNVQIMLVKKLFVMTFSDIDRNLLNKPYDQLNVTAICQSILAKLNALPKVNRYVRRNVFQASFQEVCYFYYTSIIKFTRSEEDQLKQNKETAGDFFAKKIGEDIRLIGELFDGSIPPQKIYAHLKDISLIKEFLQCEMAQVKKICRSLKKQFGNSFTESAVRNLLALREGPPQLKEDLLMECSQIVKNSADTPEQISLISSSRESFLQNWNNTRSRKSTLTLSLNEFYQNQHAIHTGRIQCAQLKQGFLVRRRLNKEQPQSKVFFSLHAGELLEHADGSAQGEVMAAYDLQAIRKCYIHPEKSYIFLVEMQEVRLQLKAETAEQAREWVRNIYEEISSLTVPQEKSEKEALWGSASGGAMTGSQSQKQKDPSTMDSYQRQKELSRQHSSINSPKVKRQKKEEKASPERSVKVEKEKPVAEDNCFKCSKGFFF